MTRARVQRGGGFAATVVLIGQPLAYERVEGVWGNREVPPLIGRRGFDVGETWFPPRERAEGERRSCHELDRFARQRAQRAPRVLGPGERAKCILLRVRPERSRPLPVACQLDE